MKRVSIELSKPLRQTFKTACVLNQITMRDALLSELANIIEENQACYNTHRPTNSEDMCLLCLNMDEEMLEKVQHRKILTRYKIRDFYITAILNYINNHSDIEYDFSEDVYGSIEDNV